MNYLIALICFQTELRENLRCVQQFFNREIQSIQGIQSTIGKDIEDLKVNYQTTSHHLQDLEKQVAKTLHGTCEYSLSFYVA